MKLARLPDDTALSGLPSAQSGRPIASYDVTGYARGAAAQAQGAQHIGEGLAKAGRDISIGMRQRQSETDDLDIAKAESNWLLNSKFHRDELAAETEPDKLKEKYEPKFQKAYTDSAALISNPQKRALWEAKRAPDVQDHVYKTTDYAFNLTKDREIGTTNEKLTGLREAALMATDQKERDDYIKTAHLRVQALADAGYIPKAKASEIQRGWVENLSTASVQMLPPEERLKALRVPNAGSAEAAFKFFIGKGYTPEQTAGIVGNLLHESKLRPDASHDGGSGIGIAGHRLERRDALRAFAKERGTTETDFNTQLEFIDHELKTSESGAMSRLKQAKTAGEAAAAFIHFERPFGYRANGDIRTAHGYGNRVALAEQVAKGGGTASDAGPAQFIPADTRMKMEKQAETELAQNQQKASLLRGEDLERSIIDAKAGRGTMPDRSSIENDRTVTEQVRNSLLVRYDSAVGDVASAQAAWAKFQDPNAGSFNPFLKDDRDHADTIFARLGGDVNALQAVVDRTGIMPPSAATKLRGDIVSNDPNRVASALALSSNLLTRNQNIFSKTEGAKALEDNAISFRHYTDTLGMTNAEAANRIIRDQSPEYQAQIKTRLKGEDIDAKIKKELNVGDLAGAFDQVPWIPFTDPKVGFNPGARAEMFGQYAEQVKDNYLNSANGDWSLAKKMAARQVGKTWGVTSINGTSTLVQYPPERSPQFNGVENAAEAIAADAIKTVKATTGQDVTRKDVWTMPIPGRTGPAYKAGEPTPYQLWYRDKDGISQMIQPGQGREFVPDANAIKEAKTAERQAAFETQRVMADARSDPLAEAKAVPAQRRTGAQRAAVAQAAGKPQVAQMDMLDNAASEPFDRVVESETPQTAKLPSMADMTNLPPHRRAKGEKKTKVADADR